jgi:triacylglycerol esterase/lipase EstA (alpha/beta hydrolase family)
MDILLVLAHGIFGWGDAASSDFKRDYFYGIKPFLIERCRAKGLTPTIIAPTVSPSESIAVRGGQLQSQIEKALHGMPKGTRTHVIAHSMGGLDTRWAITEGRMGDRIASLTTIGTPHRGTTIADLVLRHVKGLKSAVDLVDQLSDLAHNFTRRIKNQDALEFYRHLISNIEQSSPGEIERGLEALTLDGVHAFNQ